MHFVLVTVRIMVRFLIKDVFGGEALIRGRYLLEGGAYFDLSVIWCGAHLRPGAYKRKYGKAEDAQYS